jgi:Trypsin-like peptidase domain
VVGLPAPAALTALPNRPVNLSSIFPFMRLSRLLPSCLLFLAVACIPARAVDFATQMVLSTCKIYHPKSTATCFLLSRMRGEEDPSRRELFLVTAAHVVEEIPGAEATLVLRRETPDGNYERKDVKIAIRADDKPLWTKHPTEDIAVLPLKLPDDAPVFPLDVSVLATEQTEHELHLRPASHLLSAGYPNRYEANSIGFPIVRHCSIASFPLFPFSAHKTFLLDFFSYHGDSGGPVFVEDSRQGAKAEEAPPVIIGIILALWRTDEKMTTDTEERVVHQPLGLSTIIHAQFVRDVIDGLP